MHLARVVYLLAFVKLALHVVFINGYGIFRDELYYLACARHLAWGYVDQPPLAPFLARLATLPFGESLIAIRLVPALAGAALVILTAMLARELGGGRWAQALAGLSVIAVPWWLGIQHTFQMNAWEPLIWMGCAWIFIRIVKTGNERLWLWFGVLAGAGLENKQSMLVFGFGLFAGIVLARDFKMLLSKWLWAGGALAALIYAPNVVWQAAHGWPFAEFVANAARDKNVAAGPVDFVLGQILPMNPALSPLWSAGLVYLLWAGQARPFRALGWAYVVLFATFFVLHGKNYYLAPAYPMLLAAGGVVCERLRFKPVIAGVIVLSGAALAPMGLPVLSQESYIRYANAIGISAPPSERHQMGPLPQYYADMHGWKEMAEEVARVHNTLPPEDRAKACVFGQNYGEAGAIDFFGPKLGLPPAIGGHNNYWIWGPRNCGEVLIVIGGKPEDARKAYAEVSPAGKTFHPYAMPYENNQTIWICRKPRVDIGAVWASVKKFI